MGFIMARLSSQHGEPKGRWTKGLLALTTVIVIAAGVARGSQYFGAQGKAQANVSTDSVVTGLPVDTITIRYLNAYEMTETYVGRIFARREGDLGFERSGLLVEVLVSEGARVNKGQTLARLNSHKLDARLGELKANLAHVRASRQEVAVRLDLAQRTSQRREALLKRKNVSRQRYDEARADEKAQKAKLTAAAAAVREAEAAIRSVEVDLEQSVLHAPFTGTIISRVADEGKALASGETILQIIENGFLEVRVGVPLMASKNLELGQTYSVEASKQVYSAKLTALPPQIDTNTRTMTAIFDLDADNDLNSGQLVRLSLKRRVKEDGFWLPMAAMAEGRRGLWSAYVLSAADKHGVVRVSRRDVQVLHGEAERAFVHGTLRDGEVVVASGVHRLVPGLAVVAR